MNSTNYFNINFLKENLKKSKGVLAFILGILPVANILLLIMFFSSKVNVIDFNDMSLLSYVGMFIAPIILSYLLFGFLFKKNSIDFFLSKPLSRKSIYITNIIGGISIILAFTLINTIIFGLFGLFTSVVMPFKLLLDYFIYWLVSYIFMFIVTSLATTLTGNFISAVVVIMIIIGLFPFLKTVDSSFTDFNTMTYIYCDDEACRPDELPTCIDTNCLDHKNKNEYEFRVNKLDISSYTAPFTFLENGVFRTKDVVKMAILSIIYAAVGYFAFLKRKMEDCECSFKNERVHYLVKTLTFLPITFITYASFTDFDSLVLSLICILGSWCYYFIYDIITRKSVYQFKKSCFIWAMTLALSIGFYSLWFYVAQRDKVYKVPNEIILTNIEGYDNISIKDKNIINTLIKETLEQNYDQGYSQEATFKNKNKEYNFTIVANSTTNSIIDQYIKDNNIKNIYESFDIDALDYVTLGNNGLSINKELISLLKASVKEDLDIPNNYSIYYTLYVYENHHYSSIIIPMNATQEISQYATNYFNNNYMEKMNSNKFSSYSITTKGDSTIDSKIFAIDYIIKKYNNDFIKYFNKHLVDDANSQRYYLIFSFNDNFDYYYFINDVDAFNELYLKYYEKCLNDSDFIKKYGALINNG